MTPYTPEELAEGWEFKIVRSSLGRFGKPAVLRRLIEEEARAGWVMLEKFDNGRVRFKRPASARQRDHLLPPDVNPYRTNFGGSASATLTILLVLGLVVLFALLAVGGAVVLVS